MASALRVVAATDVQERSLSGSALDAISDLLWSKAAETAMEEDVLWTRWTTLRDRALLIQGFATGLSAWEFEMPAGPAREWLSLRGASQRDYFHGVRDALVIASTGTATIMAVLKQVDTVQTEYTDGLNFSLVNHATGVLEDLETALEYSGAICGLALNGSTLAVTLIDRAVFYSLDACIASAFRGTDQHIAHPLHLYEVRLYPNPHIFESVVRLAPPPHNATVVALSPLWAAVTGPTLDLGGLDLVPPKTLNNTALEGVATAVGVSVDLARRGFSAVSALFGLSSSTPDVPHATAAPVAAPRPGEAPPLTRVAPEATVGLSAGVVDVYSLARVDGGGGGGGGDNRPRCVLSFRAHENPIHWLGFNPAGNLLLTASNGRSIRVFALTPTPANGAMQARLLCSLRVGLRDARIQSVAFSADSKWVAVTTSFGSTCVFALQPFVVGPPSACSHIPEVGGVYKKPEHLRRPGAAVAAEAAPSEATVGGGRISPAAAGPTAGVAAGSASASAAAAASGTGTAAPSAASGTAASAAAAAAAAAPLELAPTVTITEPGPRPAVAAPARSVSEMVSRMPHQAYAAMFLPAPTAAVDILRGEQRLAVANPSGGVALSRLAPRQAPAPTPMHAESLAADCNREKAWVLGRTADSATRVSRPRPAAATSPAADAAVSADELVRKQMELTTYPRNAGPLWRRREVTVVGTRTAGAVVELSQETSMHQRAVEASEVTREEVEARIQQALDEPLFRR